MFSLNDTVFVVKCLWLQVFEEIRSEQGPLWIRNTSIKYWVLSHTSRSLSYISYLIQHLEKNCDYN